MLEQKVHPELSRRVDAGMEFLADKHPEILRDIDLDTLDLSSSYRCMLGQPFGHFDDGLTQLGITTMQAVGYGFDLEYIDYDHVLADLTPIWKTKIVEWREKQ